MACVGVHFSEYHGFSSSTTAKYAILNPMKTTMFFSVPNDHPRVQVTVLKSVGAGEIPVPKGQVPGWRNHW